MRLEGPGQGAAVDRLHHRRLDLDVSALLEARAQLSDDPVPGHERLPDRVVADQVERPLPVADFDVLQAMELLRRGQHALGKERQLGCTDRELSGPRAKDPAGNADHISRVKELVEFEVALRDLVAAHVDLDLNAALLQVCEARFALASLGHQAAADARARLLRLELVAVAGVEDIPQFGDGVRRVVLMRVALEA